MTGVCVNTLQSFEVGLDSVCLLAHVGSSCVTCLVTYPLRTPFVSMVYTIQPSKWLAATSHIPRGGEAGRSVWQVECDFHFRTFALVRPIEFVAPETDHKLPPSIFRQVYGGIIMVITTVVRKSVFFPSKTKISCEDLDRVFNFNY